MLPFVLFVLYGIAEPVHYYLHGVVAQSAQKAIAAAHPSTPHVDVYTSHLDAVPVNNHHSCALCALLEAPRIATVAAVHAAFAPITCLSPVWLARPPSNTVLAITALRRSRAPPFHVA